jgi:hypothetical protein
MSFKSVLKPENSMIAGLAVVGLVIANYNLHNGSGVSVRATEANNSLTKSANNSAGWSSLVMVAGISLLAKDPNIAILGFSAIIAMHSTYLEHIAVSPDVNTVINAPGPEAYQPAQNVVPMAAGY